MSRKVASCVVFWTVRKACIRFWYIHDVCSHFLALTCGQYLLSVHALQRCGVLVSTDTPLQFFLKVREHSCEQNLVHLKPNISHKEHSGFCYQKQCVHEAGKSGMCCNLAASGRYCLLITLDTENCRML